MENIREVTIDCGRKTKVFKINFGSFVDTVAIIKKKFNLPNGFDLKVVTGDHGKETEIDIDDDEDLDRFKDSNKFILRLFEDTQTEAFPRSSFPAETACKGPPSYEQSLDNQTKVSRSPDKITVDFMGKSKSVGIDRNSVEKTKDAIRRRFSIEGDFELQAKLPSSTKLIVIDDEEDVEDLQEAEELVVPMQAGAGIAKERESASENSDGRQLVPACDVMSSQLQGVEICGVQREKTYLVTINKVDYTINQPPPSRSMVVQGELKKLDSSFDIEEIIRQIDIVAMCLKMVLYGVVGNRDLEIKVVEVQAKVEELCNVSGQAVKQFGMKAGFILSQMQRGIDSLMDGYGETASGYFRKIAETSKAMKTTTESLKVALNNLAQAVEKVSSAVNKANSARIQATEKTRNEINADVTDGRKELLRRKEQQAKADRELAEKRYESMPAGDDKDRVKALLDSNQAKQNAAICLCSPGVCCIVCCDRNRLFCTHKKRRFFWYNRSVIDAGVEAEYKLLDRDKADHAEALQERERLRKAEEAATNELLEFTESLKKVDPSKEPEDLIEIALRGAEKGFKALKSAMSRITRFWDDLQLQSESIIDAGCGSIGQMESEKDAAKRNKLLESRSFQTGAVEYLAKWVAMQMMCEAFTRALKPIQMTLQCSIADTPSKQQALKAIPELVITLDKKLNSRRAVLHADDEKDAMEMKAIIADK